MSCQLVLDQVNGRETGLDYYLRGHSQRIHKSSLTTTIEALAQLETHQRPRRLVQTAVKLQRYAYYGSKILPTLPTCYPMGLL